MANTNVGTPGESPNEKADAYRARFDAFVSLHQNEPEILDAMLIAGIEKADAMESEHIRVMDQAERIAKNDEIIARLGIDRLVGDKRKDYRQYYENRPKEIGPLLNEEPIELSRENDDFLFSNITGIWDGVGAKYFGAPRVKVRRPGGRIAYLSMVEYKGRLVPGEYETISQPKGTWAQVEESRDRIEGLS